MHKPTVIAVTSKRFAWHSLTSYCGMRRGKFA